jgi:hypothetical protein
MLHVSVYLIPSSGRSCAWNKIIINIQPLGRFWHEPEPSQATGMVLARCILVKFLGVVFHCFFLPLDVLTFAARCLHVPTNAKSGTVGENSVRQFCRNDAFSTPFTDLLRAANLRHGTNGFTSVWNKQYAYN